MWSRPPYTVTPPSARWFERIEEQVRQDQREADRLEILFATVTRTSPDILVHAELSSVILRRRLLFDRLRVNRRALQSGHADIARAQIDEQFRREGLPYYLQGLITPEPQVTVGEAIDRMLDRALVEARITVAARNRARIAEVRLMEKAEKLKIVKTVRAVRAARTARRGRQVPKPPPAPRSPLPRVDGVGRGNTLGMGPLQVRAYQSAVQEPQRALCARLGSPWCRATLVKVLNGQRLISEDAALVLQAAIDGMFSYHRERYENFLLAHEERAA